jgi:radical SAM-linked protein
VKARIKFTKAGSMKFVGHLDIMRYFQKVFRRSNLPVAYSQGFNPHQILSFAAPLGVGLTSDGEYLDLQINSYEASATMMEQINAQMNDEIKVVSFKQVEEDSKPSMSMVAAADYIVSVKDGYTICDQFVEQFMEFVKRDSITIMKKTKKSEKEMDIKPYLYHVASEKSQFEAMIGHSSSDESAEQYENGAKVYLQLTTGSVINIKPELVMEAFCNHIGVEYNEFAYQVHRMEMYADLNAEKGQVNANDGDATRNLVPLDLLGKDFE